MSIWARRRRAGFNRTGGDSTSPNQRLPRAAQRLHEAHVAAAFPEARGVWGPSPMQEARLYSPPGAHRAPLSPNRSGLASPTYGSATPYQAQLQTLKTLKFKAPAQTLICHQRAVRREVLFARRVAGYRRSPGRGGSYHRNQNSQYGC